MGHGGQGRGPSQGQDKGQDKGQVRTGVEAYLRLDAPAPPHIQARQPTRPHRVTSRCAFALRGNAPLPQYLLTSRHANPAQAPALDDAPLNAAADAARLGMAALLATHISPRLAHQFIGQCLVAHPLPPPGPPDSAPQRLTVVPPHVYNGAMAVAHAYQVRALARLEMPSLVSRPIRHHIQATHTPPPGPLPHTHPPHPWASPSPPQWPEKKADIQHARALSRVDTFVAKVRAPLALSFPWDPRSPGSLPPLALSFPWVPRSPGSLPPLALSLPWLPPSPGSLSPLAPALPWVSLSHTHSHTPHSRPRASGNWPCKSHSPGARTHGRSRCSRIACVMGETAPITHTDRI